MKYLIASIVVVLFSLIYFVSLNLNKKIKVDCDSKTCFECSFEGCMNRKEEEK